MRQARGTPLVQVDATPVAVLGEPLREIWWRGRQWAVTAYGIEALDGRRPIDALRLLDDLADGAWPARIGAEDRADADEFATAWLVALVLHGYADKVSPDEVRAVLARIPAEAAPADDVRDVIGRLPSLEP